MVYFSLNEAVEAEDLEEIQNLLAKGHEINYKDALWRSPISIAVQKQNKKELVQLLINEGADINANYCYDYSSPLHLAVRIENNIEIVKLLLQQGSEIHSRNYLNATPLHEAVQVTNNNEVIKLLLDRGAGINDLDEYGTPLGAACHAENLEAAHILLKRGAKINATHESTGWTPLHTAVCRRYGNSGYISEENLELPKFLIEHGANVNAKNFKGWTPLHIVVQHPNVNVLKLLIESGADINCPDFSYKTPLYYAIMYGHVANVEQLLSSGADTYFHPKAISLIIDSLPFDAWEARNVFINHLIKLRMLNLLVENKFLQKFHIFDPDYIESFETLCKAEINKMKHEFVCSDRSVTIYHILTKSLRKVAVYCSVNEIKDNLDEKTYEEKNYDEKFPIYSKILGKKIKKANIFGELLERGFENLKHILFDSQLPYVCLRKMLDYFNEEDLQTLILIC